jgi:hypothetical protein
VALAAVELEVVVPEVAPQVVAVDVLADRIDRRRLAVQRPTS